MTSETWRSTRFVCMIGVDHGRLGTSELDLLAGTRRTVQRVLRTLGYQIISYGYTLPGRRIDLLRAQRIGLLVDVGANDGSWARDVRAHGYDGDILSIEPLPEPFARLEARSRRDPRWECEQVAIGCSSGSLTMNVSGSAAWSSPLPLLDLTRRAAPQAKYERQIDVAVTTLDEMLSRKNAAAETPVAIKIDVQGFEHAVLAGAKEALEHAALLEIEVSLVPLYEGQELWRRCFDLIETSGLRPAWIESCWFLDPVSRRGLQLNALFSRNPCPVEEA